MEFITQITGLLEYEADYEAVRKIEKWCFKNESPNIETFSFSGNPAFPPQIRIISNSEKEMKKFSKQLLAYCRRFKSFKCLNEQ